ncbi:UDP-N-acetylmuramoyl-L-alanyl-D-glutamate--2,6-diaminopimelate ligase [Pseudoroseicyclus tamaricis]|uniref:UDP-N-acetylmuramoyl-L-alanyl-D-glutamate--2,6-diaminopimelate ligase n=1 Tax=Pseudoroseicyclus tamaricis TaxID=2705421 RepID=A0A6B2JGP3_9RHOB|nr:UDP-N-acetylmuramoyl-L-alanyl-D-glutamate--2,6-diaminopimelate ligase [Pseudoroseicyclus tamaricis]NDV00361.1 UDP-N-acetylmuramoyl-L-alanyl-D-glutamate--2,6-diaminopimelate ligase [Pseudoroseicyclus tamaricis]
MTRQTGTSLADLGLTARGGREARITGLAIDSREVREGMLFAALPGSRVHGGEFIQYALRQGAGAILTDLEGAEIAKDVMAGSGAALVLSEDPRAALARAAALWYGPQPTVMVAVTGTNGKTSVASFCRQIWQELGHDAVNVGTTGVEGDFTTPLRHTTPDSLTLHKALAEAARAGITHAAMEASSHGLDQRRLDGVQLIGAGFTNLSQDHLDYHADMRAYFEAKLGLFERVLDEDGIVVANLDDPYGADIAGRAAARGQEVIGIGRCAEARLRLGAQRFDSTGQELRFDWQGAPHMLRLELIGGFQAANVAAAAGLVIASGEDPQEVFATLPKLRTVRGRMELAATRENGAAAYVDYAHTPDAVKVALEALRPHVMGRIVAIVGAGGDRDRGKRPLMGRAAAEHADQVIVTDDNPRSEDPAAIRAAVMDGALAVDSGLSVTEVADRAEAILRGVDALGPGDALLICGKGHESGQIIGETTHPFDDAEQASIAVAALEGRA